MRFSAGTKLDRYDVVGIIGAGGMGEVYRAFDPRLNRSVALKLLTSLTLSESEQRKRVLAEAAQPPPSTILASSPCMRSGSMRVGSSS